LTVTQPAPPATAGAVTAGAVTELLRRAGAGDSAAFDDIFGLVYAELHRLASRQLGRHQVGETLNATALVHEAYLKMSRAEDHGWATHRATFFSVSARAMRQIVIDRALQRGAERHGGGAVAVDLDPELLVAQNTSNDRLLAIDDALAQLAEIDPRLVQVVECRFYSGYTEEETAEALGMSVRTVQRSWQRARVWLRDLLGAG
jgi:RNA polymerase sigma factor (TIGR02999 family)